MCVVCAHVCVSMCLSMHMCVRACAQGRIQTFGKWGQNEITLQEIKGLGDMLPRKFLKVDSNLRS